MKVSAPSGVHVQQNADDSVTMTIGFNPMEEETKENIAPPKPKSGSPAPPLFKVSKYDSKAESQKPKPGLWTPGAPVPAFKPQQPRQYDNTAKNDEEEFPLLPDEQAELTAHLELLKNPMPPHLQRVVFEGSGSDREGTPDSPGYITRRRSE
jgi:hypothetical protein